METAAKPHMVMPPGEQHGVGGGLRSLTAFLVCYYYACSFTIAECAPSKARHRVVCLSVTLVYRNYTSCVT